MALLQNYVLFASLIILMGFSFIHHNRNWCNKPSFWWIYICEGWSANKSVTACCWWVQHALTVPRISCRNHSEREEWNPSVHTWPVFVLVWQEVGDLHWAPLPVFLPPESHKGMLCADNNLHPRLKPSSSFLFLLVAFPPDQLASFQSAGDEIYSTKILNSNLYGDQMWGKALLHYVH